MIKVKIASASCNQTGRDWSNNIKNICQAIDMAVEDGADFLCFEELTLTGYECGDDFSYTDNNVTHEYLQLIADYAGSKNKNLVLSLGHPWHFSDKNIEGQVERRKNPIFNRLNLPFNVQTIISQGLIISMSAKRYLFNYERGYEKRHFEEWSDQAANYYHKNKVSQGRHGTILMTLPALSYMKANQMVNIPEREIPFGSPVIKVGDMHVVHEICEELWVGSKYDQSLTNKDYFLDNPLADKLAHFDINLVINPNGSPPAADKVDQIAELVQLNSSMSSDLITVYTDGLGSSGSTFAQTGFRMMAQGGKLVSQGTRLSFKGMDYTSKVLETHKVKEANAKAHVEIPHVFNSEPSSGLNNQSALWDNVEALSSQAEAVYEKEMLLRQRQLNEELRHEALWLFDYLRKNKLSGFTQALSGGADSAYNAAKVRIMIELAIYDLGLIGFLSALNYSKETCDLFLDMQKLQPMSQVVDALMNKMLTCVYLATPNNSIETKRAAETLIKGGLKEDGTAFKGVGGKFYSYNIQPLVDQLALLYSGVEFDALPAVSVGSVLQEVRTFLGLGQNELSKTQLKLKVDNFKGKLDAYLGADNSVSGPILNTCEPDHGITIENMQARVRQVIILMITNFEKGKIGLANPNLDEICNAYTSFGGDEHSGQIALNAHKPKYLQLQQMTLLYEGALCHTQAIEGFYWILKNKPSAELQPKNACGEVVQTDEAALGRSFYQTHVISYYMLTHRKTSQHGRKNSPIEVLDNCLKHKAFQGETLETIHDMILLSYKNWIFAQHKIHAFPIAFTYGLNVDHQSSLRTPNISGGHRAELAKLAINVLSRIAVSNRSTFKALTGYSEEACIQRVGLDHHFAQALEKSMWTENVNDGRSRKILTLFEKIKDGYFKFSSYFNDENTWGYGFFCAASQADVALPNGNTFNPK